MSLPFGGVYRCVVFGSEHVYDGTRWRSGLFMDVLNSFDHRITHYTVEANARSALSFANLVPEAGSELWESAHWKTPLPGDAID